MRTQYSAQVELLLIALTASDFPRADAVLSFLRYADGWPIIPIGPTTFDHLRALDPRFARLRPQIEAFVAGAPTRRAEVGAQEARLRARYEADLQAGRISPDVLALLQRVRMADPTGERFSRWVWGRCWATVGRHVAARLHAKPRAPQGPAARRPGPRPRARASCSTADTGSSDDDGGGRDANDSEPPVAAVPAPSSRKKIRKALRHLRRTISRPDRERLLDAPDLDLEAGYFLHLWHTGARELAGSGGPPAPQEAHRRLADAFGIPATQIEADLALVRRELRRDHLRWGARVARQLALTKAPGTPAATEGGAR